MKTKPEKNLPDGSVYRKCIAWRMIAGCGCACFEICPSEQRLACKEQQEEDKATAASKVV